MVDTGSWEQAIESAALVKRQRDEAVDACTELGKTFAAQTIVLLSARRERDSLSRRLVQHDRKYRRAVEILNYALHLRMHGENAPGGDETWAKFDRMAEQFLRTCSPVDEIPDSLFGKDAGPEWHHPGSCSWPERACSGHVTSYSPVQVPENTGKHPGESDRKVMNDG